MSAVRVEPLDAGAIWRVTFGASRGNVIDRALMVQLTRVFADARQAQGLKTLILTGHGGHFSFGASVREHLPEHVRELLADFRTLIVHMFDSRRFIIAAIEGQCLGGGLELASACHRIVAGAGAVLGQPEIALGVFAPVASILLPERIGRVKAEELCLTGRRVNATDALQMGLVDQVVESSPAAEAAVEWARAHLAAHSASSLGFAIAAIRADLAARIRVELPRLEELYLSELMSTHDAVEGLRAFLDKRPPIWRHS
ncbi:MAG TPA: enoyl-CoA hydratase-related protein [Vicinamibacterales bacterium]|nr:enoyl-CoA hydratase-related protein [Vicinamibacterales bacterium]